MTTPTSNPRPRASTDAGDASRATTVSHGSAHESAYGPAVETPPRANGATAGGVAVSPPAGPAPAQPHGGQVARPRADSAAHRAPAPAHAVRLRPDQEAIPRYRTESKRRRLLLLIPILIIALGASTVLGYRYWYESTYFVSTDNASITGDLVQVGSLNAGRIVATRVDVGRPVREGQEIAVVAMPQEIGSTAQGAAPRMGVTGTTDSLVSVYAPLNGIVAARMGQVGGTVSAGQPIYALMDPAQVWVKANIEEASAWRVQTGQTAVVHVDALNRDFWGHVDAITPASAATFSLLPSGNASGNFTKVTQYVPVKIAVVTGGAVLPLGTSVEVRIQVREPTSEFPLPWQP
jgi:multidrug efflux pump subunit AcrA (membrane-fusion protein)